MNPEISEFFSEFLRFRTSKMKDMVNPSLQLATMVKMALVLWNQIDVRKSIRKFKFVYVDIPCLKEWREIEEKVLVKLAQLPIHEPLKSEFVSVISSIGVEIKNWWGYHQWEIDISAMPNHFVWTLGGTIDKKKTAKMLVKDENIDVVTRYKLACISCLVDKIPELWNRITEQQKQYFYRKKERIRYKSRRAMSKLITYWTYHLFGEASDMVEITRWDLWQDHFPHGYAFGIAVDGGNVVATEFFFDKLSDEQRNTLFVRWVMFWFIGRSFYSNVEEYFSEIFFIFFSHMSEEQRVMMLMRCPYDVLSNFLDRPFQHFFLPLAKRVMAKPPINDNSSYDYLLMAIMQKFKAGSTVFDYRQLFLKFFNLSPLALKRRAIERKRLFLLILRNLLEVRGKAVVESVFVHVNALEKEWLIFRGGILGYLIRRERWEDVKFLIKMCDSTKETVLELKSKLMRRYSKRVRKRNGEENDEGEDESDKEERMSRYYESDSESDEPKWVAFFHLLDELIDEKKEKENVE